jgi:hypothetical protein
LITTPGYDISLISYLENTFLHGSVQLKNLFTALSFRILFGLPLLAFAFFFFRRLIMSEMVDQTKIQDAQLQCFYLSDRFFLKAYPKSYLIPDSKEFSDLLS